MCVILILFVTFYIRKCRGKSINFQQIFSGILQIAGSCGMLNGRQARTHGCVLKLCGFVKRIEENENMKERIKRWHI